MTAPAANAVEVWQIENGHWAASVNLGSQPAGWHPAAIGDFDHNGVIDVMWRNDATGEVTDWSLAAQHQITANSLLFA